MTERYTLDICDNSWIATDRNQVFLWRVPDNFTVRPDADADDIKDIAPVGKLSGHPK
jgi:coronin-1B/1C/6